MKNLISPVTLLLLGFFVVPSIGGEPKKVDEKQAATVAINFINSYVKALPSFQGYLGAVEWVKRNPLVSAEFKKRLEQLYRTALQEDPEMGYGADAVLGGQDFPEAYLVETVQVTGDKAIVHLKGVPPLPLPLRVELVRHKDSWLVNASGDLARAKKKD